MGLDKHNQYNRLSIPLHAHASKHCTAVLAANVACYLTDTPHTPLQLSWAAQGKPRAEG